jgi:hypothetical protein
MELSLDAVVQLLFQLLLKLQETQVELQIHLDLDQEQVQVLVVLHPLLLILLDKIWKEMLTPKNSENPVGKSFGANSVQFTDLRGLALLCGPLSGVSRSIINQRRSNHTQPIMKLFIAIAALVAVALADHAAPAPSYAPRPVYHQPQPEYNEPAAYTYGYAVADDYSHVNFAQDEQRNGYATSGSYRVALPDGRTQIVTYTVADDQSGYNADVSYEGVAQYPEDKPAYKAAPAAYAPRPAYHA